TFQVNGDRGIDSQVLRSKRTCTEIEAIIEPNTPHWTAMKPTIRMSRCDPIVPRPGEPFSGPLPGKPHRFQVTTKHKGLVRFGADALARSILCFHCNHLLLGRKDIIVYDYRK